MSVASCLEWINRRRATTPYTVQRIPLATVPRWAADTVTGDLVHHSGRFFAVRGLEVTSTTDHPLNWAQPILDQPEIGVLGILCRPAPDGAYEFLLQAKMEPGNVNLVQLSPTLQATFSNYSRVHGGRAPHYLEHFDGTVPGKVIADTVQPETGTRFWKKRNRNVIIELERDPPVADGFRWIHQQVLERLLLVDDLVNMDARSVLSTLPNFAPRPTASVERKISELRRWIRVDRRIIPLNQVQGWIADGDCIRHESQTFFEVVGVRVIAAEREVASWGQPLLLHRGLGLAALFSRADAGVRRYLFQAKFEAGNHHLLELGPTVSVFDYQSRYERGVDVPYLREYMDLPKSAVLVSTVQSEEGGRFWDLRNRYVIVDVTDFVGLPRHESFVWLARDEIKSCLECDCLVSSEARSLILYADLVEGVGCQILGQFPHHPT
ncbi:MAG: NDP-hexose 2,3-dehydratase family protein [Pseudonocardiaceae bacterium]